MIADRLPVPQARVEGRVQVPPVLVHPAGGLWCRARIAAAGLLALTMAVPGCDLFNAPPPAAPPAPPEVVVATVAQRDVPVFGEWLGTTDGTVNAEIRSRVQGYLQSQNYSEGAVVKAGDLMYQVDPRPFEAALAQAKADLARAEANYGRTQIEVGRLMPLAPSGAISQQDVDNAVQENKANKAAVEAAQANVEQAQLHLNYTRVIAPIDGVAGISRAQVGDLVGDPGSSPLTTVSTLDPIRVYFPISEQEYMKVSESVSQHASGHGDKPAVQFDLVLADGSTYGQKGRIDVINRQVDSTTGTIRIAAVFPNPGNVLRPGQYARVRAVTRTKSGALLIPQRSIMEVQGTRQVAVVGADGKVAVRAVKASERVGSDWVIDEGLKPGEQVVVEGLQKVKDGMTVTTKPFEPGAKPDAAPAPKSN